MPAEAEIMNITLGNEHFHVEVTTPMTECMGEYGPRFETLGAVTGVSLDGLSFCAREGLVDEFNIEPPLSPPGYDAARPGDPFVKIGVGELLREDDDEYCFSQPYIIRQLARVRAEQQDGALALFQSLRTAAGWGYDYCKTYRVLPDAGTLVIEYELTNTGQHRIHAEQYNHNWFNFGGDPVNEEYSLRSKFDIVENGADWVERRDQRLDVIGRITEPCYFSSSHPAPAHANWMHVGHAARGSAVTVSGDFDVARFALFADHAALCPEVFFETQLAPNQSRTWKRIYEFHQQPCGPISFL